MFPSAPKEPAAAFVDELRVTDTMWKLGEDEDRAS